MKMQCSAIAMLLALAACRNTEPPARTPETPPAPSSSSGAPAAGASLEDTPPPREGVSSLAAARTGINNSPMVSLPTDTAVVSRSSDATALTDDQILYVLHAANLGGMDQARVASKRAKNGRVKRFATMMLEDHGEADVKVNEVAKKVHASLAPSERSNRLESDAKQLFSSMSAQEGNAFDRSYIDAQVKEHRGLLESIDRELLPSVRSADVKEFVQTVRAKVESHLKEAEDIQKGLG